MHSVKLPYKYGSEEMMNDLITENRAKGLNLESSIEEGNTIPNILEMQADLIVMGSKGKSNLEDKLFGSVASTVILESGIPVLVIPSDCSYSDFKSIIFTTDYRDHDLEALQYTIDFAALFDAKITILHIALKDNLESKIKFKGFKKLVTDKFDYSKMAFNLIIEEDFLSGLSSFLDEDKRKTDLLVATRYKKTFIQSLLKNSRIKQAGETEVPLMVLPGE